ncbi:cupredoxin domain-containing protein [Colwellia sp. 12G3]|nr:cupredoxin domain-containing protein [Colwellia sp. 12G3]
MNVSKTLTRSKSLSKAQLIISYILLMVSYNVSAQRQEFSVTLKDHLFYPAEISIPANKKVKLVIDNQDDSIEEFDSFSLNREKVLFPKQKSTIYIGPLSPGRYDFFGEYHPNSARGVIIVSGVELAKPVVKGADNAN